MILKSCYLEEGELEMAGFYLTNLVPLENRKNNAVAECLFDKTGIDGFYIDRCTLNKFVKDKCFFQDNQYLVILEGYLLNKKELFQKYNVSMVSELILSMYRNEGDDYFKDFRGSFSGILYDSHFAKWVIYTNHYGDNTVFYYHEGEKIVVSSQYKDVLDTLKANGIELSVDDNAIRDMLTYGFMSKNHTYVKEIKRLMPGTFVTLQENRLSLHSYYRLKDHLLDLSHYSESEIIDELDRRFRNAIKLEYEKDLEYGYKHINQLSGGLDSRMNVWVARDMGYQDMLCITFAQSNSADERISQQIGKRLQVDNVFWPMDSARHLLHIDEYVSMNNGLALYGGVGATKEIFDKLDFQQFGLVHTGQLGDVVIDSYVHNASELSNLSPGGMFSKLIDVKQDYSEYRDREEYLMNTRGFLGILSTHLYMRNYTEVCSPFINIDFLYFCMSIPLKLRLNHHIYKSWILTKYPHAADFIWEKSGGKITEPNLIKNARKYSKVIINPKRILRKAGIKISVKNKSGMSPFDLWWEENEDLRTLYNRYYQEHISQASLSDDIRADMSFVYQKGSVAEKMQVITALAAVNMAFCND